MIKPGDLVYINQRSYPGSSFKGQIGTVLSCLDNMGRTIVKVRWETAVHGVIIVSYRSDQLFIVVDPNELLKEIL